MLKRSLFDPLPRSIALICVLVNPVLKTAQYAQCFSVCFLSVKTALD